MLELGFLLGLGGTVVLAGTPARPRSGLGLVLLAVAIAASRAAGYRSTPSTDDRGFELVNAGLLLGGIATSLAAAIAGLRLAPGWRTRVGGAAVCLGCVAVGWGARLSLSGSPTARAGGAILLVVFLGEVFVRFASRFRSRRPEPGPSGWDLSRIGWPLPALLTGATLAAATGRHLVTVFAGAAAAACAGYLLLQRVPGSRALPVLPGLSLLLIPTGWLFAIIAGPEGLSMAGLPDLPLSQAAQTLLAPPLLLVAFGFAGIWPFQKQAPGMLLAPVGALLVMRVGVVALPEGLEHWRALVFPLLVAGLWQAALTRRPSVTAAAGALLAICSLAPEGRIGSVWLLGGAILVQLSEWTPRQGRSGYRAVGELGWLAIGWGGLLALEAGLEAEVVYSVLGALGVAAGLAIPAGHAMSSAEAAAGVAS